MRLDDLRSMDKDDLLKSVGLQQYQSAAWTAIPGVALFGLGVLVGAGIGILFAPRPGHELREDLMDRVGAMKSRHQETESDIGGATTSDIGSATTSSFNASPT